MTSAFSNAFNARGRGRGHSEQPYPLPAAPMRGTGGRSSPPMGRVTYSQPVAPGAQMPMGPQPAGSDPRAERAERTADRRKEFRASVDASRETRKVRAGTFLQEKMGGADDKTARQRGHLAGLGMLPPTPTAPAGGAAPQAAGGAGVAGGINPASGAAIAAAAAANPYVEKFHESKLQQAKSRLDDLKKEFGGLTPEERTQRAGELSKAQAGYDTALSAYQGFLQPAAPVAPGGPGGPGGPGAPPLTAAAQMHSNYENNQPLGTPGAAAGAAPGQAEEEPFVSQKGRMAFSEQMAKTMYDAVRERIPDPAQAEQEFSTMVAEYGVDGRSLVEKWMNDGPPGGNSLGFSTERRGGEDRLSTAPPAPEAPRRVMAGGQGGRSGIYEAGGERVMVDASGQRVGGSMGPATPTPPRGPQAELGPYSGFNDVSRGPDPKSSASPQNVATMDRANANAGGKLVVGQTATNRKTGKKVRWSGSKWESA